MTKYIFGARAPLLSVDETRSNPLERFVSNRYRNDTKENFMKTKTDVKAGGLLIGLGVSVKIGVGIGLFGCGCGC